MAISLKRSTLGAYLNSLYVLPDGQMLEVGHLHKHIEDGMDRSVLQYAWLTASNPGSNRLSTKSNSERNRLLEIQLSNSEYRQGFSQSKQGHWREEGFWVFNRDPEWIRKIAQKFGQNGFVYARRGQSLKLILCEMH